MEYHWILFSVLLQLTIHPGGSSPTITPSLPHVVVQLNGPISLHCQGEQAMRWQREDNAKVRGEVRSVGLSVLRIPRAQPLHMGRYLCVEEDSGESSSIYVYVKEPDNAFRKSMVFNVIARSGDNATIPCLATDPGLAELSLETCDGGPLPQGLRFLANRERGIVIYQSEKAFEHCYVCTGKLGGANVRSHHYHLIVRPVPATAPVIELRGPRRLVLLEGQTFSIACSTTNVNGEIKLRWTSPPGSQPAATHNASRVLPVKPIVHQRSANLSIAAVTTTDSGHYRCEAQNERGVSSESVSLTVHVKGFIHLERPLNSTVYVRAGESLSLRVELEAYPSPHHLYWSFRDQQLRNVSDHVIITSPNHTHGYNSELRLVRIKVTEGGVYTFNATNTDATATQNFTVYVISKPEIVSHEGPLDGQVRCVAEGFPAPQISWYYCEQPHMRCSSQLNATLELQDVVTFPVSSQLFGRTGVESRINVSRGMRFNTLECLATADGETAYTLFSISEWEVQHELFTPLLIGFVSAAAFLFIILIILFYKYLQKPKFQIQWKVIEGLHGNNYVYIDPTQLPYDCLWEFPRDKLRFGKTLGSGAFGKVVEATAYGLSKADTVMTVAVKMLKPSAHATEKEALMSELKVLSYLGNHMNIVNLLGACTVGGPVLVITEYCCFGDLLNFLRRQRESFFCSKLGEDCYYRNVLLRREQDPTHDNSRSGGYMTMRPSVAGPPVGFPSETRRSLHKGAVCGEVEGLCEIPQEDSLSLDTEDLLSFSYQVAKGMDFLASKNCIHRDLAARNILLTQGRVAKICDFGLARDITTDCNYVVKGNARLPVKWMSPESIFECVYTFESDVWSYGILLWEIFSLGNSPYPGMPVDSKFYKLIKEGYRMDAPEFAPTEMYQIMRSCWDADPIKRPPFRKIVEQIEQQLSDTTKHIYLNFNSRFSGPTGIPPPPREDQNSHNASFQNSQNASFQNSQNAPFQRLDSNGSSTASTQPLLVSDEGYLEGVGLGGQRV